MLVLCGEGPVCDNELSFREHPAFERFNLVIVLRQQTGSPGRPSVEMGGETGDNRERGDTGQTGDKGKERR